jgi:endonuclease/exonuclease/phosphatase family metal-dependent hydrolase
MSPDASGAAESIRFMTFNLRFDTVRDAPGGNRWADRIDSVIETIGRENPAVVGFQEALKSQLADVTAALSDYRGVGKPREIGDTAEYVPLFFDLRRFELEEYGDFWLSPTPDLQGSRGWDTDVPRHCTWARLNDRRSGARFAAFNTHLDVKGSLARWEAAKVILTKVAVVPGLPSVVLGDFNATEDTAPLETFRAAGFRDTFREIHPIAADVQTIHHYGDLSDSRKLDYILCDGRWKIVDADIIRAPAAGRLPSDHFPVTADLVPRREQELP